MSPFKLKSNFKPVGDQETAVSALTKGVEARQKYQTLLGVTGSGKSLIAQEPILIFENVHGKNKPQLLPIGELIDSLFEDYKGTMIGESEVLDASQVRRKFSVPSMNPKSGRQELKPVTQFVRHTCPPTLYYIRTTCGRNITVTADHNFWVLREGKLTLVKTEEIESTDYIPAPMAMEYETPDKDYIRLDEVLKRETYFDLSAVGQKVIKQQNTQTVLGYEKYYAATHEHDRISTSYLQKISVPEVALSTIQVGRQHGSKIPLFMRLTDDLLYLLGIYIAEGHAEKNYFIISAYEKSLQLLLKNWLKAENIDYTQRRSSPGDFQISNSILSELLSELCGRSAYKKKLPVWFGELSTAQLGKLLSAYFSGDGSVSINEISSITASKELASQLSYALLRFGIHARIREKFKRATNSRMQKRKYFETVISGGPNLKVFSDKIGFVLVRKQAKLESTLFKTSNTNVDVVPVSGDDIFFLRSTLNLFQKTLANEVGCTRSHLSLIEHGKRRPSRSLFIKILNVFESKTDNSEVLIKIHELRLLAKLFWTKVSEIKPVFPEETFVYDIAVLDNETFLAGMGGLYVHNTFTMANVIERTQRPALIISHNKTLAAQLYQEFRDFFPENAVSYFVSYYDYYQPEAYIPSTDTYIEKDSDVNDLIDKLRLAATTNLLTRPDTIVIASVSCIYNIGSPREYANAVFQVTRGMGIARETIIEHLVDLQYERGDFGFHRGTFRVRGDSVEVYPAYQDIGITFELEGDHVVNIFTFDPITGGAENEGKSLDSFVLYPAKHFMTDSKKNAQIITNIEQDLAEREAFFKEQGKILEANRIHQKVTYDLEMIQEVGYTKGIENYSRYFDGRKPGESPNSLMEYFWQSFNEDWLVFVDESHITFPQVRGMYAGDLARKRTLVDYGFRLPSAFDNRPLMFEEFMRRIPNFIAVSATPSQWELSLSDGHVVEQLVRPTGIPDPEVEIRPTKNQVADVIEEVKKRIPKKERTLITTLTKKTAEDLSEFMKNQGINVHYLHSDVNTLDRTDILDDLRAGKYDALIGINLLREGLDLPEVSLVAILDADKEGFLRSDVALIQTMGRAARHLEGRVILYADRETGSMQRALDEVRRRRVHQLAMNKKYNITPTKISKPIREKLVDRDVPDEEEFIWKSKNPGFDTLPNIEVESLTPMDKKRLLKTLTKEMRLAANDLNFELAARIRDKVKELQVR